MYKKISLMLVILALGGCRIVSQRSWPILNLHPIRIWRISIGHGKSNWFPRLWRARPVAELMTALRAAKDIDSACKALGYRAQDENRACFSLKVEGNISKIDSASRSGK